VATSLKITEMSHFNENHVNCYMFIFLGMNLIAVVVEVGFRH
jgi:hypothetical protein